MGPGITTGFGTEDHIRLEGKEFLQDFDRRSETSNIVGVDETHDVHGFYSGEIATDSI
jgi:hypothetical protein